MNAKELSLLIPFLDDYEQQLSNNWEFPENWSIEEKRAFVKAYHDYNGDPHEYDENDLTLPDFAVVAFLASKLLTP